MKTLKTAALALAIAALTACSCEIGHHPPPPTTTAPTTSTTTSTTTTTAP